MHSGLGGCEPLAPGPLAFSGDPRPRMGHPVPGALLHCQRRGLTL